MCAVQSPLAGTIQDDLQQMIEPLANYLCVTDQPRTALRIALRVLLAEMKQTNRAAAIHMATLSKNSLNTVA